VISCDGNGRHFQVETGGILNVHGIKLFNGSADMGGAIIALSGGKVFLGGGTEVESCRATAGNGDDMHILLKPRAVMPHMPFEKGVSMSTLAFGTFLCAGFPD
jgi:hypothetical protein